MFSKLADPTFFIYLGFVSSHLHWADSLPSADLRIDWRSVSEANLSFATRLATFTTSPGFALLSPPAANRVKIAQSGSAALNGMLVPILAASSCPTLHLPISWFACEVMVQGALRGSCDAPAGQDADADAEEMMGCGRVSTPKYPRFILAIAEPRLTLLPTLEVHGRPILLPTYDKKLELPRLFC